MRRKSGGRSRLLSEMSANNSPTKQRRFAAQEFASKLACKLKGAEYRDNLNPHALNSFEYDRFRRFYIKAAQSYHYFESECDHLAEIYGEFRPDKLKNNPL